jgi:putative hemolysin
MMSHIETRGFMKANSLSVRILVAGSLASGLMFTTPAMAAMRCEALFSAEAKALLEFKPGVRQTGKAHKPLALQVVESRYQIVADTINAVANALVGRTIGMNKINEVTAKFLADKSGDPYFMRLARAFDITYKLDEAALMKNVPKTCGAVLVLNHAHHGSEGIALAAAISKFRPDTKIALTSFLENVPEMVDNSILINPYGGGAAKAYNAPKKQEMIDHVKNGGVLIIFASGEVSIKSPNSDAKPVDKDWQPGVAQIVRAVPEVNVVPVYIGGESSTQFYKAREKGLGIRTLLLHVKQLGNNAGREFPISFSAPITGKELNASFGTKIRDMMRYLRARTFLMHEQSTLKAKVEVAHREMLPIAESADPALVHADIANSGKLMFADPKKAINVYAVEGSKMSDLAMRELGIAREKSFRVVGEGSGKELDVDHFDKYYVHLLVIDTNTNKILAGYRAGRGDKIMAELGPEGFYTSQLFDHRAMLKARGAESLELGRSFVDFEAGSKAIIALDRVWKGLASYLSENPQYRYLIGPVSISNAYSETSIQLMMKYLERNIDPEFTPLTHGYAPVQMKSQFKAEIDIVAQNTPDLKELGKLVTALDGQSIPPLLISYNKLGAKYLGFNFDKDFNTVDGLIMVDLLSKDSAEEGAKHFGDKWTGYLEKHGQTPEQ